MRFLSIGVTLNEQKGADIELKFVYLKFVPLLIGIMPKLAGDIRRFYVYVSFNISYRMHFSLQFIHIAYDMKTGKANPAVYFNEFLIFNTEVFFCRLIPKEYKVCPIKKGGRFPWWWTMYTNWDKGYIVQRRSKIYLPEMR